MQSSYIQNIINKISRYKDNLHKTARLQHVLVGTLYKNNIAKNLSYLRLIIIKFKYIFIDSILKILIGKERHLA